MCLTDLGHRHHDKVELEEEEKKAVNLHHRNIIANRFKHLAFVAAYICLVY